MGTKDFKQDNGPHQSGESSKLATTGTGATPNVCPSVTELKIRELLLVCNPIMILYDGQPKKAATIIRLVTPLQGS
jgi:hypothetical protein